MNTILLANKILPLKQKISLLFLTILLFIGGLFELMGISLILPIINIAMDSSSVDSNSWCNLIKSIFNLKTSREVIIALLILIIIVYVVKNCYVLLMNKIMYELLWKYKSKLSTRLLNCYMYQDYTFHLNKNVSEIQRNILTDVGLFYDFIIDCLNIINQGIVCLLLTVYLLTIDFKVTFIIISILSVSIVILYSIQHNNQEYRGKINREASAEMNKWIIQSFTGIKEIQVLGRQQYFLNRCKEEYARGMNANKESNLSTLTPKPIMEMICIVGLLGVMLVNILLGAEISSFVSLLSLFAVAAFRMLPCFNSISARIATMSYEKDSVQSLYNDLIEMETIGEKRIEAHSDERLEFKDVIAIKNVTYSYPNSDVIILDDVSLSIFKNQSVGIMGTSGSGKSTLIDIVLGVLPLKNGEILVDDKNIYENLDKWHNILGYIPQTIYLMDDTIKNNVAFGIPEEKISEERLWKSLEEAQIADFVKSLPDGINSNIGDRGVRISGGQRQRLGIARALYNNPEVLVFDEATSALDNETEAALMEAIDGLKGTRTLIIIAHRLNTIKNCDVIYEVKDKKVRLNKNI